MADILKVSTPLIDKAPVTQAKPVDPSQPFVLGDITKVVQTNESSELLQQHSGLINQEDGPKLLADLIKNPSVTVSLMRNIYMLQEVASLLPAHNTPLTEELGRLFDQLMLSPQDIVAELEDQEDNSTIFKGPLFDTLRALYDENKSNHEITRSIADVLKSLSAQNSSHTAVNSLANNLTFMRSHYTDNAPFSKVLDNLIEAFRAPDAAQNFNSLKGEVLQLFSEIKHSPLLTPSLERTISLAIYNMSRFNDSSELFPNALTNLMDKLPDGAQKDSLLNGFAMLFKENPAMWQPLLENGTVFNLKAPDFDDKKNSRVMKTLSKIINLEAKSESVRAASGSNIEKIVQSLLSSPSNFTPLLHFIVPVMYDDMPAFAEMWIDPNPEDEEEGKGKKGGGPHTHAFVVFDIHEVGKFEVDIKTNGNRISVDVLCPAEHADAFRFVGVAMRKSLSTMSSSYSFEEINIGVLERDRSLIDVFKDLPSKRMGINARI